MAALCVVLSGAPTTLGQAGLEPRSLGWPAAAVSPPLPPSSAAPLRLSAQLLPLLFLLRRRPLLLPVLRAQIRDTWSNRSRPAAWASLWPALIAACIALFHFKESTEKPVPGRQQKVKTQLTPIRALSQAPREVMKYGSGEICNALLSGLGYNGVHANYACRLPPAPGRRTTQRAPGPRPGLARSASGRREQGGARGRRKERYVERKEAHTWRRKGCREEGKSSREEWSREEGGAQGGG